MIIKIVAIGLTAAILAVITRKQNPEYSYIIAIAAGLLILAMVAGSIALIFENIKKMSDKAGIPPEYITMLIKVMGVAYLTQFASSIAKDAGESAIANKIELGGKIAILVLVTPLFFALLNLITGLL